MIISVAHDKGGVGKTTTATNLIIELSKLVEVSALDIDPKKHFTRFLSRRKDDNIKLLDFETVQELRTILENNEGVLVIDVGGMDSDITRNAIAFSDKIITPLADSMIELDGLNEFKKVIQSLQKANPDLKSTVLMHRVHPNTNISTNSDIGCESTISFFRQHVLKTDQNKLFNALY